jgi:hypothetical protein
MLKQLLLLAIAATITPGTQDLYSGTRKLSTHPDLPACIAAAKARGVSANYTCRTRTGVVVAVTVDPPPPLPPIDCVVSDAAVTSDWSACSNGVQTRSTTWSRNVVTQPANGGAACPKLADPVSESRSCSVDPPPSTASSVLESFEAPIRQGSDGPLWSVYSGPGKLSLDAACAHGGAKGARIDVTAKGKPYLQFYPYNNGWRLARTYAAGYQVGKYNRLGFWLKTPIPQESGNQESIQFGTYTGQTSANSGQGDHYYHFLNTVPNVWTWVEIDANSQALQGAGAQFDPPIVGGATGYFDTLSRFYFEITGADAPAGSTMCFDEFTFFAAPTDEDVASIGTLEASYDAPKQKLHVGFQRDRYNADVAYSARWSPSDFHVTGFNAGTPCGVSGSDGMDAYSAKKVECAADLAGLSAVYVAVQKAGRSDFHQIRLALQ